MKKSWVALTLNKKKTMKSKTIKIKTETKITPYT